MPRVQVPRGQSIVLDHIDWRTYRHFLRLFEERPGYRLTYDRGVLEIMSPSARHGFLASLLGRFIEVLTEELGLTVKAGEDTTFRSRRAKKGLEPDKCYWIANEPRVRHRDEIDLRVDPPPDLCLEVEVTRSALNRMRIYARLGGPEVWRMGNKGLTFHQLQSSGRYVEVPRSLSFPMLAPSDMTQFLALRLQQDNNAVVRQFRDWVRQSSGGANPPAAPQKA